MAEWKDVTPERVRKQYAKNAEGLRWMQQKAERTGKKYNGYTAEQLARFAEEYERKSKL